MSTPTIVARCCALTTMACLAVTGLAFSSATRVMTGSRPVESGLTSCAQTGALDAASASVSASAAGRQRAVHAHRAWLTPARAAELGQTNARTPLTTENL